MIPALLLMMFGCEGSLGGDPLVCDEMAVASVSVTLTDPGGNAIEGAHASYTVDGGASADCTAISSTVFVCGYEQTGHFVVDANAPDFEGAVQEVDVQLDADECHPQTASLVFVLEPEGGGCLLPGCGGDTGG